jgi:hypothetical protein
MNWYERSRRRILLDFHIPDWDPSFLSRFDPEEFAGYVVKANATAATIFANTHTGLCNYPTRVGKIHKQFINRDILGEAIDACHRRGLDVVIYYCTIFVDWYWDTHPQARMVDFNGESRKVKMSNIGHPYRFSVSCPNNLEYRSFVKNQLEEICDRYDFEGVWPDMTFWPMVCYCPSCQERYRHETGLELPRQINWEDPNWVRFVHKRQEWLVEFADLITSTIKAKKTRATVAHQSMVFSHDWKLGPSVELAEKTDWLSADLYGGKYYLSFMAKLFYGLSGTRPFEQINSWCYPDIFEHSVTRTEDELRANTFSTLINGGAMVFIDAIDPIGTIHKKNYLTLGKIFSEMALFESYAGGKFVQDIGIYFSYDSDFDLAENGNELALAEYTVEPGRMLQGSTSHRSAALNLTKTLLNAHFPFGVITKKDLDHLSDYQVILLPNVAVLDDTEVNAFRAYVANGGSIYASKNTSLISYTGIRQPDFTLSDLFGVTYLGETQEILTYVKPTGKYETLFNPFSADWPVTLKDTQVLVKAHAGAEVLATLSRPYTDPTSTQYASILTSPPGIDTEYPALILNHYGKGKVIFSTGIIEIWDHDSTRNVFANLIRQLASRPFRFETDAPSSVELTLFHQDKLKRYVLNVLSYQQELPNLPVYGIRVKVWLGDREPVRVLKLPNKEQVSSVYEEGPVTFEIPRLDNFAMFAIDY